MRPESQQALHFGVNFLFAPNIDLAPSKILTFQQQLSEYGIVFDRSKTEGKKVALVRKAKPLQVKLEHPQPPLTQFLIVAPNPERVQEDFVAEAEQLTDIFAQVWSENLQIVRRDCTVRFLYATTEQHAFKYLWEDRLGQSESGLLPFDRPVTGGGLRIVMPSPDPNQAQIEVKVESFLRDSSRLFVETQFVWQAPAPTGTTLDAGGLLKEVLAYAQGPVVDFIQANDS